MHINIYVINFFFYVIPSLTMDGKSSIGLLFLLLSLASLAVKCYLSPEDDLKAIALKLSLSNLCDSSFW